jgi:hypothetical protein
MPAAVCDELVVDQQPHGRAGFELTTVAGAIWLIEEADAELQQAVLRKPCMAETEGRGVICDRQLVQVIGRKQASPA